MSTFILDLWRRIIMAVDPTTEGQQPESAATTDPVPDFSSILTELKAAIAEPINALHDRLDELERKIRASAPDQPDDVADQVEPPAGEPSLTAVPDVEPAEPVERDRMTDPTPPQTEDSPEQVEPPPVDPAVVGEQALTPAPDAGLI